MISKFKEIYTNITEFDFTIKFQRKPTCFNGGMNLVDNFAKIFGSLK